MMEPLEQKFKKIHQELKWERVLITIHSIGYLIDVLQSSSLGLKYYLKNEWGVKEKINFLNRDSLYLMLGLQIKYIIDWI